MARKTRARSRHKARKGRSRHVASGLFAAGAVVRSGWGRFVFGILIGLALGVGGVLYLGGLHLGNKGGAKVTTLNASPVQKSAEAPAKPKPAPQVVEPGPTPSHAKPLGEEAKAAAQTSRQAARSSAGSRVAGRDHRAATGQCRRRCRMAQELGRVLGAARQALDCGGAG